MNEILKQDIAYTFGKLSAAEQNKLKDSTVFITGCAGFLGYYFLHFFQAYAAQLNIKIIATDNFMLGKHPWLNDFETQTYNVISDEPGSIPAAHTADYIIHMASIASPMFYRQYPLETVDANVWGLRKLLDFYRDKQIKGLLYFSSSELYGDPDPSHVPTDEEYNGSVSATGPRACYDESKRFCETLCMLYAQKYDMPIGVARPFNNYGPGMSIDDKRVPADFAKAVLQNKDIEILSQGTPTRTFCYIADAIVGYLKILLHGKYDYFNIGISLPEISVTQLAEIYREKARDIFGYTGDIVYNVSEDKHYLTHNPQRRCPNITKAQNILNYQPEILVDQGVERFLKFLGDKS